MSSTQKALRSRFQGRQPKAAPAVSYQGVVGGLVSEMVGSLPCAEPHDNCPPYRLVIVSNRGTVVFECDVERDGRMRDRGPLRKVRRSHFPAVALLTDKAFFTRTFLIDRESRKAVCR